MKHLSACFFLCAVLFPTELPIVVNFSGDTGSYTETLWKQDWPAASLKTA